MFSEPQKNIEQFHVDPGMKVADLGAGSGAYSFALARIVGDAGKVYAVDVQQDLVSKIKSEALSQNLNNVEVIWGDIEEFGGSRLADMSVERVVIANTFFQVENKTGIIDETKRILKPSGKVMLVDWEDSFGGLGPQAKDVVHPEEAKRLFESGGLAFEKEISAGSHHYGLIFKK